MPEWKLEIRKISSLEAYNKNPRLMSKEKVSQLKKSLEKFGVIEKPVVTCDGLVIGGHQRLRLLRDAGVEEVECWVSQSPMSGDEVEELNIRLNRNVGDWDWDILANQWDLPDLLEWGFTEKELLDENRSPSAPKVTLVFEDPKDLEEALAPLSELSARFNCTMKVKQ